MKPVNLNELIESSTDLFARTKKEIRIHKRFQNDIWPVEVDRGQIEQVLLDLYVNAWRAMPEGGELFIETGNLTFANSRPSPTASNSRRFVRISVTDTWLGMEEAVVRRVFDPFFTTKAMGRGTGLGLSSSYGIVRNRKGTITVYSEKGRGTTFKVYLPSTDKAVLKKTERAKTILKGSETILLVDDENIIIQVGGQLLERGGFRVITASGGKEAIEIYCNDRNGIDLVILDHT